MGTLETIMQMKQQGVADPQIIQTLQQQGIPPNEINEALSQSQIKTELAPTPEASIPGTAMPGAGITPTMPQQPMQQIAPSNAMQPSMSQQQVPGAISQPMTQEMQPSAMPAPEAYPPAPAPEAYPPAPSPTNQMPYYDEYQPQQSADIETINDIAEQIVEEKTSNLKQQIINFTRFKDELILEVEKINQRLLRIENTFNQLQMAILGKVGEYGDDIKNISKEMHTTQESFSKMMNPLTDNLKELQKITGKSPSGRAKPKTKKSKDKIENYLR